MGRKRCSMRTFGWRGSCCVPNSPTKGGTRVRGRIVSRGQLKPHPTRGLGFFWGGQSRCVPNSPAAERRTRMEGQLCCTQAAEATSYLWFGFFWGGRAAVSPNIPNKQGRHGRAAPSHAGDRNPTLPAGIFAARKKPWCPQEPRCDREGTQWSPSRGGRAAPAPGPLRGPGRGPRGHPAEPVLQLPAGPPVRGEGLSPPCSAPPG